MPSSTAMHLRVVVPVFNDWESFDILLRNLDRVAEDLPYFLHVTAIDDGSTKSADAIFTQGSEVQFLNRVEIVRLSTNVGHQRAIAIGLCLAVEDNDSEAVLVMDSDGEDPPEAIRELLKAAADKKDFLVVAARGKRTENLTFKASYVIYKTVFKAVTGKKIGFGNFSLFSYGYVKRLVMLPDLWNNLAAAVLRSKLPISEIFVDRGKRYAGKSQMNSVSLIVHGFSAIAVYADTIFVRLLMSTIVLVGLTVMAIATTVLMRLFIPAHATPGWATTVSFGMTIVLLQVLFTTLTSMLSLLNSRVQKLILPIVDFKPYVEVRELVYPRASTGQAKLSRGDLSAAKRE